MMLEKRTFYVDGVWVAPQDGTDVEVIDPSTEEAFTVIALRRAPPLLRHGRDERQAAAPAPRSAA